MQHNLFKPIYEALRPQGNMLAFVRSSSVCTSALMSGIHDHDPINI